MIAPWEVIKSLEVESSKNVKADILKQVPENSVFWEGAFLARDPMTTFGVKKMLKPKTYGDGVNFDTFRKLADALASRELTGNRALEVIHEFSQNCTQDQWENWYFRILSKKLDCGADTTITKQSPSKWKVTPFGAMLATDIKNVHEKYIPKDAFVEAKYDGVRCIWIVRNGVARAFSRNGKEFLNFGAIADQLAKCIPDGTVIDGEVISESFNSLMTQAQRKTDANFSGLLMAFDTISFDEFASQKSTAGLKDRRVTLEGYYDDLRSEFGDDLLVELSHAVKNVNVLREQHIVTDLFQQQLEAGFEGIMIKQADSPYEFKRSRSWLKMKPTETWDLKVVNLIEGTGKYEGMLGALVCEGIDDASGHKITVKVGSGLSDDQRKDFWATPDKVLDHVSEIMADSISQNQDGSHSLRFPRFVRFRDDK